MPDDLLRRRICIAIPDYVIVDLPPRAVHPCLMNRPAFLPAHPMHFGDFCLMDVLGILGYKLDERTIVVGYDRDLMKMFVNIYICHPKLPLVFRGHPCEKYSLENLHEKYPHIVQMMSNPNKGEEEHETTSNRMSSIDPTRDRPGEIREYLQTNGRPESRTGCRY
jgi:hypothetical protein